MSVRNYSTGLRIYCADRKKNDSGVQKIPSPKVILNGFLHVTVKSPNSYVCSLFQVVFAVIAGINKQLFCNCLCQQLPVHTSM